MAEIWSPERIMTNEEAAFLISKQFPELSHAEITKLGEGFDNTVFMVNKQYVFRFPRRASAVKLLETERQLLPMLTKAVDTLIPVPIFIGKPGKDFPWIFIGYSLVQGITPADLSPEKRMLSIEPLAAFLKDLHAFPIEHAKAAGVPYDELGRLSIAGRKNRLQENIKKAVDGGLTNDHARLIEYAESLKDIEIAPIYKLVHGDMHFRNLIMGSKGKISGVIDWGDSHIGHPAVDLSIVYSFFPVEGRRQFFNIYGSVDFETQELARFKAVYTSLLLLLYGADRNDTELVKGAQEALNLALL